MKNEIFIRTDKGEYIGGETIYGAVYINVISPFGANSLSMELKGYEKVFWEYNETEFYDENGETKSRTITKDHKDDHDFFKDHFKIIDYPGGFPVGQFYYPFQYRLPDELPGVFEKSRKNGLKMTAKIVYKIKAILDVSGTDHDLKCKQHLIIHERLDKLIEPKHFDKSITVMTCCCFPRGDCRCECWMDKNAYICGEAAQIHVKVTNDSAVKIENFNTKLIRYLTLKDQHGHTKESKDIICMQKYDGTEPHTAVSKDVPLQLLSKKNKAIKPATSSKLVKCEYKVMVEMAIPWAPDLEIYAPVTIYAPVPLSYTNFAPPPWVASCQIQQVNSQIAIPSEMMAQIKLI